MRKSLFFLAILLCFSCFLSSFFTAKNIVYAEGELKVLGFGDSISAGYAPDVSPYNDTEPTEDQNLIEKRRMLINYKEYYNSTYGTTASKSSYTYLFGKAFVGEVDIQNYANSGDKSSDLAKLLTYKNNYQKTIAGSNQQVTINNATIVEKVKNANIITLCIGANDVLSDATDKLYSLSSDLTKLTDGFTDAEMQEFRDILDDNVNTFNTNYNDIILPALNKGAQIYVMTIYNPYKYTGDFGEFTAVRQILDASIEALDQVNEIIRNSASKKVFVVDVVERFDAISQENYKDYVNVDLESMNLLDLFNIQNGVPYYLDPHPTPLGQRTIADMFIDSYNESNVDTNAKNAVVIIVVASGVLVVGVAVYLIIEKIKYRAIKF